MIFQTCCAAVICLCSLLSGQLTSFRILYSCDELLETATAEPRQYQCRRPPWLFSLGTAHPCSWQLLTPPSRRLGQHPQNAALNLKTLVWVFCAELGATEMKEKFHRGIFQLKRKPPQGKGRTSNIRILPFWPPAFSSALILS